VAHFFVLLACAGVYKVREAMGNTLSSQPKRAAGGRHFFARKIKHDDVRCSSLER